VELKNPQEIERFVDVISEYGRAPLSAYWEICRLNGAYLDELKFPVSRSILGEVRKRVRRMEETGMAKCGHGGSKVVWSRFRLNVVRRLKKLGLLSLEDREGRVYLKPLVGRVLIKAGEERSIEEVGDIVDAHLLLRRLKGGSKTRQRLDKRLRYEVKDTVAIVFPSEYP